MKTLFKSILSIIASILFLYIFIFSSILFLLTNKSFYYLHIKYLNLSENTKYSIKTIKLNYNAMLNYLFPFSKGDFHLPSMPYSPEGKIHFEEVKNIFNIMTLICIVVVILLAIILYYYYTKKESEFLKKYSINCILITLLICIIGYINFDKSFIIFHKIFFRNNYWIFDKVKDPIITILPQEFFRNCSILIFTFIIIGSLSLYLIYKLINKKIK